MEVFGFTEGQFFAALLLLARIGGLFVFVPIFSHPFISLRVKSAAALVITFSLAYSGLAGSVVPPAGFVEMTMLSAKEAAVGLMLGLTVQIVFLAVLFGGQVVGIQMGLNIASIMDPQFHANVSEVTYIYYYCALLIFLSIGGDRMVFEALAGNLHTLPLGHARISGTAVKALVYWSSEIFSTGLILAAPVLTALFCTSVLLGVLARSVPQINMLMLGYSLKIMAGMTFIGLTMPMWMEAVLRFMGRMFEFLHGLARLIGS